MITFQHRQFLAAIITPTGGLLIDDACPKYHSGTNGFPPSQGKQWNEHRFNQLRVMDLMSKSFPSTVRARGSDTCRMRRVSEGMCLCESCKQERCFLLAVISLRLMISECGQPLAVNLKQMKCIAMCRRGSLIRRDVFGVGRETRGLSISRKGIKRRQKQVEGLRLASVGSRVQHAGTHGRRNEKEQPEIKLNMDCFELDL